MDKIKVRRWFLVALTLAVFGLYSAKLMDVQIIHAQDYQRENVSLSVQTVKATRGEIVDRNGVSLVSNRLGYDVVIDNAYFPLKERNDILLRLMALFEKQNTRWNDNLPLSTTPPYGFLPGLEQEAEQLKTRLKIQSYSTAEDTMFHLVRRYSLEDYSASDARKIAGVRYEMELRDFSSDNPYTFASDIGIDLVLEIKERSFSLSGVDIEESAIRQYDMGDIAPHLIGRTGAIYAEHWQEYKEKGYSYNDRVGISGVELALEEYLRGQNGKRNIMLDSGGQVVEATESVPTVLGNTAVLTIDSRLQRLAQLALEGQIKYLQRETLPGFGKEADVGAVVVIHVPTGQILASATYPSFNQSTYSEDYTALAADANGAPLLNRALMGQYAPGSIYKPVVGTAGLTNSVITEDSTVYCGMVYTRFSDYHPKCLSAHGNINVTRALSTSCNIFFYDTGWLAGIDTIDRIAKQYGLGEPTGIELKEAIGQRSNPETAKAQGEEWANHSVVQTSIGQLYNMFTPLQLANYAATIANRGQRLELSIVKEIQDYSRQQIIKPYEVKVADQVEAPPEAFETVIKGMVSASRVGTAVRHFSAYPIDVASKTGTPESEMLNSTFICFAPAEKPEIAIAVVIENGYHGYTGAPVARAILDEYFGFANPAPLVPKALLDAHAASIDDKIPEAPPAESGESSEEASQSSSESEGESAAEESSAAQNG